MFVALDAGQRPVTLRDHEQAKALVGDFVCPACRRPVGIRNGRVMPAHFYHLGPPCAASEPESAEHLAGKLWLMAYGQRRGFKPVLEQYYPQVRQRADVVWQQAGRALALEFQCSPISLERLAERSEGYRRLGVPVVWIMGKRYFARQPKALQAKFLAWSRRHGWHLWFLDVRADRLVLWQLAQGLLVTWYRPTASRRFRQATGPLPTKAALGVATALRHREPKAMALQAASATQHRNLAGVPWLVHAAPTGLIGLPLPEWQLRAWWLLTFDAAPDIKKAAEAAFWQRFAADRTPLVSAGALLAAVAAQWHRVLTASGAWQSTATGWQWRQPPAWYPTLEAKLAAVGREPAPTARPRNGRA
ncbi:competence protein CoiA [Lacticaseibacillus parakribbianus]|uniref:competence protein CoiA n=1 Tax=Lacticaseibacillus parakribbianus TaxID=2970927 RepID=UPI0021CB924A|nr:competence protein CoiA family protein [Lacticaseibacillus parakribbianus]